MIIMYSQNHAADALATQGATTSATMVLTLLSQNKTWCGSDGRGGWGGGVGRRSEFLAGVPEKN